MSEALKLPRGDILEYFSDGRRASFIVERRIEREVLRGRRPVSEGAPYDVEDPHGRKWEVRSITAGGVYFCPSKDVGSGRAFHEDAFLSKANAIEGYVLADITTFPTVPYWFVASKKVLEWYGAGKLGAGTKTSRDRMLALLSVLPPYMP